MCSISPTAVESLLHVLVQLVPEGPQWTGVDYELSWRVLVQVWVECMRQQPMEIDGKRGGEGGGKRRRIRVGEGRRERVNKGT